MPAKGQAPLENTFSCTEIRTCALPNDSPAPTHLAMAAEIHPRVYKKSDLLRVFTLLLFISIDEFYTTVFYLFTFLSVFNAILVNILGTFVFIVRLFIY